MAETGMNTEEVTTALNTIVTEASELDIIADSVFGLAEPLSEAWKGGNAEDNIAYLAELGQNMKSMSDAIMAIHDWTVVLRNNYEEVANDGSSTY